MKHFPVCALHFRMTPGVPEYVASPAAAYITGTCLRVDCGTPNARGTWKLKPHHNSQPFVGFHRAQVPEMLKPAD